MVSKFKYILKVFIFPLLGLTAFSFTSKPSVKLALVKYNGGGDWYANPTSLRNLSRFCNANLGTDIDENYETVDIGSPDIFNFPYLHITGHGNIIFSDSEADNLRSYLEAGGFLHISDNFGIDPYLRKAMKSVFPDKDFVELPWNHPIYHQKYDFNTGLPKIHEHDKKSPQGFGIFVKDRLVCFYDYECDLGDGWEDPEVHKDPEAIRQKALKMGANIIQFAFSQ